MKGAIQQFWQHIRIAAKTVMFAPGRYLSFLISFLIIEAFLFCAFFSQDAIYQAKKERMTQRYTSHAALYSLNPTQTAFLENDDLAVFADDILYQIDRISSDPESRDGTSDLYIRFIGNDLRSAERTFRAKYVAELERMDGGVIYETTPLFTFLLSSSKDLSTFFPLLAIILGVSVFSLILLITIHLRRYRFEYGIYLTFGARRRELFRTSIWEFYFLVLVTLIPASILSLFLLSAVYGFSASFSAFSLLEFFLILIIMLLLVTVSLRIPLRQIASSPPNRLILSEDNAALITSPRRSVSLSGKGFPADLERLTQRRFRKYYLRMFLSVSAFLALFFLGLSLADLRTQELAAANPEYRISFSVKRSYLQEAAENAGVEAEDGTIIRGNGDVVYPEEVALQYGLDLSSLKLLLTGDAYDEAFASYIQDTDGVQAVASYASRDASYMNSFLVVPGESVSALSGLPVFPADRTACMLGSAEYRCTDTGYFDTLPSFCTVEGDLNAAMQTPGTIILGDSAENRTLLKIHPGDTVRIAKKAGRRRPIHSEIYGDALLEEWYRYNVYDYLEFTVGAVIHSNSDERLPVFFCSDDYITITGEEPVRTEAQVYLEPGLSEMTVAEIGSDLRRMCRFYSGSYVTSLRASEAAELNQGRNQAALDMLFFGLILLLAPVILFLTQSIFYRGRLREFEIYDAIGVSRKGRRTLLRLDGRFVGIVLAILSAILALIISAVVRLAVNRWIPGLFGQYGTRYAWGPFLPDLSGNGNIWTIVLRPILTLLVCALPFWLLGCLSVQIPFRNSGADPDPKSPVKSKDSAFRKGDD